MATRKITVQGIKVVLFEKRDEDFLSLTDIAKYKNPDAPTDVVKNWLRSKNTIEFLGFWEKINNPDFKLVEFDQFWNNAGANAFVLSPQKWIEGTNAIGIISKSGRGGGTYAHKDIAFEFATWVSAEFKLYIIKEFQRLKADESERQQLGWDVKRLLTKVNYKLHTDAIKAHLIPHVISRSESQLIYANEADVLNVALFGMTVAKWRENNKDKQGNIRDYADVRQLVCLANLESLNAEFIRQGLPQAERLVCLNEVAIVQMQPLLNNPGIKRLEG